MATSSSLGVDGSTVSEFWQLELNISSIVLAVKLWDIAHTQQDMLLLSQGIISFARHLDVRVVVPISTAPAVEPAIIDRNALGWSELALASMTSVLLVSWSPLPEFCHLLSMTFPTEHRVVPRLPSSVELRGGICDVRPDLMGSCNTSRIKSGLGNMR